MSRPAPSSAHDIPAVSGYSLLPAVVWTLISCQLLLARMVVTGQPLFFYLIWNLFLAWIPFAISLYTLHSKHHFLTRPLALLAVAIIWLLFFPNAPYIFTDLIHLKARGDMPVWYDTAILLSFALNGLVMGCMSLAHMHILAERMLNKTLAWIVISIVIFLTSFGIYLGRVLRWNSWDILTNPIGLFHDIVISLIAPSRYPLAIGTTVLFTCFLFASYWIYLSLTPSKLTFVTSKKKSHTR